MNSKRIFNIATALTSLLCIVGVAADAQFSIKNNVFDDLRANYLPMMFANIEHGYHIGPEAFGNKWAAVNITGSEISLPGNDAQRFTDKFKVTAPKDSQSNFGLSMKNMTVELRSNFTANILIARTAGKVDAQIYDIDIDLDIGLDTQPGQHEEMVPQIKINKVNLGLDKKKSFIHITGGVLPWMLNFIETMLQSYLIDYIINELETQLYTTFQDDINQLALKYLQTLDLGNDLGLDLSLSRQPIDAEDHFSVNLKSGFFHEDPQTKVRTYADESLRQSHMTKSINEDIAFALSKETLDSLFEVIYKTNMTIKASKILSTFSMGTHLMCDDAIASQLPNMKWDPDCKGDKHYPLDIELSLPAKPNMTSISQSNSLDIGLPEVRLRAVRIDTNKTLMDFIMKDFQLKLTTVLDLTRVAFSYDVKFMDAKLLERGQLVKDARDTFLLSQLLNYFLDFAKNFSNGLRLRYLLGITMRSFYYKLDYESQSVYIGLTPDPIFLGKDQHQGIGGL